MLILICFEIFEGNCRVVKSIFHSSCTLELDNFLVVLKDTSFFLSLLNAIGFNESHAHNDSRMSLFQYNLFHKFKPSKQFLNIEHIDSLLLRGIQFPAIFPIHVDTEHEGNPVE